MDTALKRIPPSPPIFEGVRGISVLDIKLKDEK
jgi:hypothetical protein